MNKLYTDLNFAASYAGINALRRETKNRPEKKDLNEFLIRDRTYTLHKPRRYRFQRLKTIPTGWMTDLQADLGDFQALSKENSGYRFLLVTICVLSRKMFVAPLKSKFSKDMIPAFTEIFRKMPQLPLSIYTDKGGEFESREMQNFFKNLNIKKYAAESSAVKSALAERAIRTIKTRLYKYFSEKNTVKWYDVIQQFVRNINNSVCRTTGMKPNDINEKNAQAVWDKLYTPIPTPKKPKYRVGDQVRLALKKEVFDRGYLASFSDEIFDIALVNKTDPPTYVLKRNDGSFFKGKIYENQMSKTIKDSSTTYRIEKVLRRKKVNNKLHYFVKFVGFSNAHNSWITEDDFV